MEAILFIGIQATGKSSFFKANFFNTHIRINLDMLRTRHREEMLLNACIATRQPFVVDNTNVTAIERAKYINLAKAAEFRIIGYYFESKIRDALRRNASRSPEQRIPDAGVLGTHGRLECPVIKEGFDQLKYVRLGENQSFIVEDWRDEI